MPLHGAGRFVERAQPIFRRDEDEMIACGGCSRRREILVPHFGAVVDRARDDRRIAATLNQERSAHDERHGSSRADLLLPRE